MRSLTAATASAICMLLVGCAGKGATVSDHDRSQAIDQLAHSVITQRGVPGIAIAVIRDGKLFHEVTLGSSDVASRRPVSSATPFQLASTTKLFSSAGVLLLVADGKFRLDDPIGKYLDGLPSAWRPITIRQLLSHTSGLPDITRKTGEVDLLAGDWDTALPIIADQPFQFRSGTAWAYNQTNYALLQRLIERVSGMTFEDFLRRRLFGPLDMQNTFFPGPQRRCATNYERTKDGRMVERDLAFPAYVHAAGGLCSSLDDLVAWSGALESGKVIPRGLLWQARTPAKLADGSDARIAGPMSYGLGSAIDTTPGHRWAGHSGGNSSAFRQYLDDHITVIVLHNGASDPDAIADSTANSMLRQSAEEDSQANLWDAAENGDRAGVEAALRAGANVNALDTRSSRNGRYALNWAAIGNHPDLIALLLKHGAAINAQNLTGFTALHHAAESGSSAAAQALLAAGADASLRNSEGESPSAVARRNGNAALASLIDGTTRRMPMRVPQPSRR